MPTKKKKNLVFLKRYFFLNPPEQLAGFEPTQSGDHSWVTLALGPLTGLTHTFSFVVGRSKRTDRTHTYYNSKQ